MYRNPYYQGDDPAQLLRAAADGDQRAWRLIVQRHNPALKTIARRLGLNEADQEDVAQRTWLRLFQHIERVREPAALSAWLTTVARRECLRVLAAGRKEVLVDETSAAVDPVSVDELAAARERRAALRAAVSTLPIQERRIVHTHLLFPSLSYAELGQALGVPRGSIGPTRGRGLRRLRSAPRLREATGAA